MSTKTDSPNPNIMLSLFNSKDYLPVRVDYSLLCKHLVQLTSHFVLVGIEDDANERLSTIERFGKPRARDIRFAPLPNGGWSYLEFPLEPREKIRTFRLNEPNGLLAVITWFDEPMSDEGMLRMRLRLTQFPKIVPMPGAATQQFSFEIKGNIESSPDAWIDIREDLIAVRVHELEDSTLRVFDWKTGLCRLEDRCPRGSQGTSFVFLQDDAIAVACRDTFAVKILAIPNKDSATATPPYPKLAAAIRTLKIKEEYLPDKTVTSSIVPWSEDEEDQPPPLEPALMLPSFNCFSSIESNIVVINMYSFGRSTDIVVHRETLLSFSPYASPLLPTASVEQYVGDAQGVDQVIIPWEKWGAGKVEVFHGFQGDSMTDGSWYATLTRDLHLKIYDFGSWAAGPQPTGSAGKVILDEIVEYADAILQFREKRVFGMLCEDRDDLGWFQMMIAYKVGESPDKENSDPTNHDDTGSESGTTRRDKSINWGPSSSWGVASWGAPTSWNTSTSWDTS